ncbi:MAG: RidA family protein [Comamonadaceae bacterium]|nr:MAG: RidA family protein [Comamonadaceae bacterium]
MWILGARGDAGPHDRPVDRGGSCRRQSAQHRHRFTPHRAFGDCRGAPGFPRVLIHLTEKGISVGAIPLSHHRSAGDWVFTSGQVGRTPDGTIPPAFSDQMRAALESLKTHLESAGASVASVVKTTVFLTRDSDFAEMNDIYAEFFGQPWPARSTIVTGMVRAEFLFEIEAIAYVSQS